MAESNSNSNSSSRLPDWIAPRYAKGIVSLKPALQVQETMGAATTAQPSVPKIAVVEIASSDNTNVF